MKKIFPLFILFLFLIGSLFSETIVVENYTFNKATKQITFTDYASIKLESIEQIVCLKNGRVLFRAGQPDLSGSVSTNVLTLIYDTNNSEFSNGDKLQIKYIQATAGGGGGGAGDASAANQVTGNASLATIATNTTLTKGSGTVDSNTLRAVLASDGPTVTNLSNVNTNLGAQADSAATTDTGNFSLISFIKRGLQNWTTLLSRVPALVSGRMPVDGSGVTQPVSGTIESYVSTYSKGATALGHPTSTSAGTDRNPLDVILYTSSGTEISPSTAANQTTANASLSSIDGKLPSQGSALPSASHPVTLPIDVTITGQVAMTTGNNAIATDGSTGTDVKNYHSSAVQIIGSSGIASGAVSFEQSNDNSNWSPLAVLESSAAGQTLQTAAITIAASTSRFFVFPCHANFVRCRISTTFSGGTIQASSNFSQLPFSSPSVTAFNPTAANFLSNGNLVQVGSNNVVTNKGSSSTGAQRVAVAAAAHSAATSENVALVGGVVTSTLDTTLVNGDMSQFMMTTAGQAIQKPYGTAENDWQYAAAASGIVNTTTAVTIKAAGAASIRNYITGVTIMAEALGTATELAIRDGAAGTVIFRIKIPTSGLPTTNIKFPTPLRGTAATLLEVVTLTASTTGAVYFNTQGYQSF